MKQTFLYSVVLTVAAMVSCQTSRDVPELEQASVNQVRDAVVEASCGQCQFGLEGLGCDLAVRIDGVAYFVEGTSIDDHGDAHASNGFCNAIRQARVSGEVIDDQFVAANFELLAPEVD